MSFPLIFFHTDANVVRRANNVKSSMLLYINVFGRVVFSIENEMRPVVRGIAVVVVPLCSVD